MTFDTHDLRLEYKKRHPNLALLLDHVKLLVQKEIKKKKIKYHTIISRVKSFNSFQNKIHRKSIENPFEDIRDLAGVRIVCLYLTDLDIIKTLIKKNFDLIEDDNKIIGTELNVFEYMSWHFIVKLREPFKTDFLKKNASVIFEIQLRTVAQDAWASISHHLEYKKGMPFSNESKRDFNALSGLFYVADTHFSMLKKEKEDIINKNIKVQT